MIVSAFYIQMAACQAKGNEKGDGESAKLIKF